ncbi:hypothetical protein [Methylomonas koyamae]|uniref:hypothetical protein n=1 Tax=Methylomonas koyamae TaxID=702114 RepID=UPI0006D0DD4C|nr:hypothetical protein [Methylomonas koyamae]
MTDTLILLCAAGSAGSVLAALWHCRNRTRLAHLAGQQTSIAINRELKQLLGKIQQHRGMASGYLNGDASFKYKISALQAKSAAKQNRSPSACILCRRIATDSRRLNPAGAA